MMGDQATSGSEVENEPERSVKTLDGHRAEPAGAPAEDRQRQRGRLVALHEAVPVEASRAVSGTR